MSHLYGNLIIYAFYFQIKNNYSLIFIMNQKYMSIISELRERAAYISIKETVLRKETKQSQSLIGDPPNISTIRT